MSQLLDDLISALCRLPGVGPKSAQRIAFQLLQRGRKHAKNLARALDQAVEHIGHCQRCNGFSEHDVCARCNNPKRDAQTLCVVSSPADISAIEQTASFNGQYFVLMGQLSPIDGIGPEDIGCYQLEQRLQQDNELLEVIIATNPTIEGEATAHFIAGLVKKYHKNCSRIAFGVPMGGELEYVDGTTLARALASRASL